MIMMRLRILLAISIVENVFNSVSASNTTCITAFEKKYAVQNTVSTFTITSYSVPLLATIKISSAETAQPVWLIDNIHLTKTSTLSDFYAYTYTYVLADPQVAQIGQPARLNQIAFLLNNIAIGTSIPTPATQVWWTKTNTGCTTITASDLQAVFWALTQPPGACDLNPNIAGGTQALCQTGITPNTCNVAYLWNLAFAKVPDGSSYSVPYVSTSQPVLYPLILVPSNPNRRRTVLETDVQFIVAVNINSWSTSPPCLNNTCVAAFKSSLPAFSEYYEITTGAVQTAAYVYTSLDIAGIVYSTQAAWCVDYDQQAIPGTLYPDSPLYTYEYVVSNPSVAVHIDRPQHLNQVAYLVNNIVAGKTSASTVGSQVLWGKTYTGCKTISASDFQAAVWALVQSAGECDLQPTAANGYAGKLCTSTINAPNTCNVAYLWNLAFANVPNGTSYSVTVSYSTSTNVTYPLVLVPTANQSTQVQIIAVNVNSWGPSPQCCVNGGFYYLAGSTVPSPCRARYYCPNSSTPTHSYAPVKCPAGYYCPTGTCTPNLCPCGYKCPAGSSAPIACQPPFYCPSAGASSQTLCPLGYMCPSPGMCSPIKCPPGTFVSCAGKVSCSPCPAGRYCPLTNVSLLCPPGYVCPAESSDKTACPAGHYCHVGSASATPCPPGTFNPDTGSIYHTACTPCADAPEGSATCASGIERRQLEAASGSEAGAGEAVSEVAAAAAAAETAESEPAGAGEAFSAERSLRSAGAAAYSVLARLLGADSPRRSGSAETKPTGSSMVESAGYALLTMAVMLGTALSVRRWIK